MRVLHDERRVLDRAHPGEWMLYRHPSTDRPMVIDPDWPPIWTGDPIFNRSVAISASLRNASPIF